MTEKPPTYVELPTGVAQAARSTLAQAIADCRVLLQPVLEEREQAEDVRLVDGLIGTLLMKELVDLTFTLGMSPSVVVHCLASLMSNMQGLAVGRLATILEPAELDMFLQELQRPRVIPAPKGRVM